MPLRVARGKTIIPSPPPLGAKVLPVPLIYQEQTQWCWAGCADMVLHYYGNVDVRQCDFANWLFDQSECCSIPGSSLCNGGCPISDICRVYNAFGLRCCSSPGTISFAAIQLQIDQNCPLESAYIWTGGGGGHVAIVRGYYDDEKVHVNDPWFGQGVITYADLVNAYGLGSWVWTFTDLRR